MDKDVDRGIRRYMGSLRDLKIIDEHPEIVKVNFVRRSNIVALKEELESHNPNHALIDPLRSISDIMEEVSLSSGAAYFSKPIINKTDYEIFDIYNADLVIEELSNYRYSDFTPGQIENVFSFINSSIDGYVFYSNRQPRGFTAYRLRLKKEPGYILLDATADLTGMTAIMEGMEDIDTPQIDYSPLRIKHVRLPKKFDYFANLSQCDKDEYEKIIKEYVVESTTEFDKSLIVVNMKMAMLLGHNADPDNTTDWNGRKVNIIYWGNFLGSNRYKLCNHVFLFGEFHLPKSSIIAMTAGYQDKPISEFNLNNASGQNLKEDFKLIEEGHLLRHFKQMASRGRIRNSTFDGRCGDMTLHTTIDIERLINNLKRVFPGCTDVEYIYKYVDSSDRRSKKELLIELLANGNKSRYSYEELRNLIGVTNKHFWKHIKDETVSHILSQRGWTIQTAKELGLGGKDKYIVKQ